MIYFVSFLQTSSTMSILFASTVKHCDDNIQLLSCKLSTKYFRSIIAVLKDSKMQNCKRNISSISRRDDLNDPAYIPNGSTFKYDVTGNNKLIYYLYITLFSLFPHRIMQPGKVFRAIATNFDVLFCVIHSIFWIIHILVPELNRNVNIFVPMDNSLGIITKNVPYKS